MDAVRSYGPQQRGAESPLQRVRFIEGLGVIPGPRQGRLFSTSVAICTNSTLGRTP